MGKLFDVTNPFWTFIGKFVDVFILHVVWLICCIPVFTIGPATTALYYALMKLCKDEGGHYVRQFFKSFKQNFRSGIAVGFIYLIGYTLLFFALYYYSRMEGTFFTVVKVLSIAFLILFTLASRYVFALYSKFETKVKTLWKNALLISIRHLGWSLLMVLIFAAFTALEGVFVHWPLMMQGLGEENFIEILENIFAADVINPAGLFEFLFIFMLPPVIIGYGLTAYFDSYIMNRVFKPYIEKALEESGVTTRDPEDETWIMPEDENAKTTEQIEEDGVSGESGDGFSND